MKYLISMILITISIYSQESIFPYPFTFNESNLYINNISIFKSEGNTNVKVMSLSNNNDEYIMIHDNIVDSPECTIKTIQDFKNDFSIPYCNNLLSFFYNKKIKNIKVNNFQILIYGDKNEYRAVVFEKNKYIIEFSSNMNLSTFIVFLQSIKKQNIPAHSINYYIEKYHLYMNKAKLNQAFRHLVCAFILDSKDQRLKTKYNKLFELKQIKNDLYRKNLYVEAR